MSLVIENVGKEYPTRSGPLRVLSEVSLSLNRGEAVAVTGPSGCGKSTLLHIVGTLDRPTTGTVELDGADPFTLSESASRPSATGTSASSSRTTTCCHSARCWKTS